MTTKTNSIHLADIPLPRCLKEHFSGQCKTHDHILTELKVEDEGGYPNLLQLSQGTINIPLFPCLANGLERRHRSTEDGSDFCHGSYTSVAYLSIVIVTTGITGMLNR